MATDDDLATLRARVDELEGLIQWTSECYPAMLPWGGAQVEMTWGQFNGLRSAIGLKPLKPMPRRKTPEPSDARIAELTENYDRLAHAYCRVVGIAPDEPISDAGREAWQLVAHEAAVRGVRHENARIAEVEQAAIQWRLRMAELETEAQESDARIAVLEAALRELEKALDARAAGTARPVYLAMIDSGMSPLLLAVDEARREARRALGEETSGG